MSKTQEANLPATGKAGSVFPHWSVLPIARQRAVSRSKAAPYGALRFAGRP